MITNKYKYPELKRIENTLGRFYIDPENNEVPSVTTVLDNMSDKKSSLSEWRNRVGDIAVSYTHLTLPTILSV